MPVLVIAEFLENALSPATLSCMTAAAQLGAELGAEVDIVAVGGLNDSQINSLQSVDGIHKIYHYSDDSAPPLNTAPIAPEYLAQIIHPLALNYSHVLAAATQWGKNLLPRLAALADIQAVSDVTQILGADHYIRPVYAGNALAEFQDTQPRHYLTIRSSAFPAAVTNSSVNPAEWERTPARRTESLRCGEFVDQTLTKSARPELQSAARVVSFGRGIGSKDNVALIEQLADRLGAAIGASRAAVDAGYAPNDYQVGQTGKIIAPDLYIAVGISGAVQHLAGIKDAKTIVAINKDADAPIFKIADFGLVGDLFEILPEFMAKI